MENKKTNAVSYPKTKAAARHKTAEARGIAVVPRNIPVIAAHIIKINNCIMVVSRNITAATTSSLRNQRPGPLGTAAL